MASKKKAKTKGKVKAKAKTLGFLAVSATAAMGMATFPLMPGFDDTGPTADLQAQLAKVGDWKGYALAIDGKGKVHLKGVKRIE